MRVLTGIQPTNILHIGNLFGALLPAVALQKEHDLYLMIADYHAITVAHHPEQLSKATLLNAAAYLAAGIDPKKTVLFVQSHISSHTELAWILQTQTRMGELSRMTQFKDKSGGKAEAVSVGLFTYPTLMAADILLYHPQAIPVGEDQKQHVELTRDLAIRFNNVFGNTFPVPEPMIPTHGARIKSLTEPEKKMSKSAPSAKSYLSLLDDPNMIAKKVRSAVTDSESVITYEERRAGLYNLLMIFHLCTGRPLDEIALEYAQSGMKVLKDDLTQTIIEYLAPIQERMNTYLAQPDELNRMLAQGAQAAKRIAEPNLQEVKKKIGLLV